jgi:hypothetical protein
VVVT